jgi:NAD(P)-dependent dehydrogenase (short-subunit alcohol dehydrogenase family)
MAERFAGKVILIAGGTGGLGRSVSLAFLDELARVTVTYQHEAELVALRGAAGGHASSLDGQEIDVTDEGAVRQLTTNVLSRHGRLDVFVNAVGGYAGGTPLWDLDSKVFDKMFTLNLRSGYVLLRAVVPVMLKQKRGAIVNVASRSAFDHVAGVAAYSASKAAAVAMIDSLAADLMGTGVRANSIIPSIIDTEANRKAMPGADFAKWPKPEDIARVILFLCSDDAKLVHGACVPVYGNA